MNAFVARIEKANVELAYPPKNTGFAMMTAITDPDGNYIEFTQLSDHWFKHLKSRREKGIDVISRWEETKN